MKDFTLKAYRRYIQAIKASFSYLLRFDEYFLSDPKPNRFCLIRHDVDRKPKNALEMAQLENEVGINATYYFRAKPKVFNLDVIKEIKSLGHEIGYHYESLSDNKGDMALALKDFEDNLRKFREIVSIRTTAMHGAPLSHIDNRDLWRDRGYHRLLLNELDILGEVYLDIDYSDIAYINDTGRNWFSCKSNIRDQVVSNLKLDFNNGEELYDYLASNPDPRVVFQVHPERWSDHIAKYYVSLVVDKITTAGKHVIRLAGTLR